MMRAPLAFGFSINRLRNLWPFFCCSHTASPMMSVGRMSSAQRFSFSESCEKRFWEKKKSDKATKSPPRRAVCRCREKTLGKAERHLAQPLAVERIDRVRQRRRKERHPRFADAARLLRALDDVDVGLRRLRHAQ